MRIEVPREFERCGTVLFYGLQKVYELDSGLEAGDSTPPSENSVIQRIPYESLYAIESNMAIVVPVRNEKLKLIQGVLCGIPHQCLTIVVSNTPRAPIDHFSIERDSIETFCRFIKKRVIVVHQKDPVLAEAFKKTGYAKILGSKKSQIKNGKAEGMLLGLMLARLAGKEYVGFVDSDNYFPGAVLEYVHEYAAGFAQAKSKYAMVRISWHSKPKIVESNLYFAKWGRTSVHTNHYLNGLLGHYGGYETEIIKTGNAGEHAISMALAMQIEYAAGYSVEPYHLVNLIERFGAVMENPAPDVIQHRVEVYQIESRNPHLHEVRGEDHVDDMILGSLGVIYHSPVCPDPIKKEIVAELHDRKILAEGKQPARVSCYPALSTIDLRVFSAALKEHPVVSSLNHGSGAQA